MTGLLDQIRGELGGFRAVSGSGEDYLASFERGTVRTHAKVDDQGRFTGLFLERS